MWLLKTGWINLPRVIVIVILLFNNFNHFRTLDRISRIYNSIIYRWGIIQYPFRWVSKILRNHVCCQRWQWLSFHTLLLNNLILVDTTASKSNSSRSSTPSMSSSLMVIQLLVGLIWWIHFFYCTSCEIDHPIIVQTFFMAWVKAWWFVEGYWTTSTNG